MSEQARFDDDQDPDNEVVWRDSAGNGLTQAECEDLAYRFRYYQDEQELLRTENYWKFMRWCQDHGIGLEGDPDGSAVLRPKLVHKPVPHKEWRLFFRDPSDDDLPPAA